MYYEFYKSHYRTRSGRDTRLSMFIVLDNVDTIKMRFSKTMNVRYLLSFALISSFYSTVLFASHSEGHIEKIQVPSFHGWLVAFKAEAKAKGISSSILDEAFKNVKPSKKVVKLDRNQPESKLKFTEYLNRVAPPFRVKRGRKLLRKHRKLLASIRKQFGVQPRFIVALWAMETDFGRLTGGFNAINALVTLAYDGRRSQFFRGELLNALRILQAGHIKAANMKGSWAGAMGQTQFMPSTFMKYAIDFNKDGRTNVWTDSADALASGANYLSKIGWNGKETWGREVSLPADFSVDMLTLEIKRPISFWQAMGVRQKDGKDLPVSEISSSVIQMDDGKGQVYMVYNNYSMILDWNRSKNFATAVGILSDRIGQR